MAHDNSRVRVEQIDWPAVLPWVRLFGSFRLAIDPPKLLVCLLLVIVVFVGGTLMDHISGSRVRPNEVERYATLEVPQFKTWLKDQSDPRRIDQQRKDVHELLRRSLTYVEDDALKLAESGDYGAMNRAIRRNYAKAIQEASAKESDPLLRRGRIENLREQRELRLAALRALQPRGVFETACQEIKGSFEQIMRSAASLEFGFRELVEPAPGPSGTVVGAMRKLWVTLPGWMWHAHPWFGLFCGVYFVAVWALLGGTVCRMAALHATREIRQPAGEALRFAVSRWLWLVLSPFIPLALLLVLGLLMAGAGAIFFNIPVLDIVGSLLFFLALLAGLLMAMILLLLAGGAGMLYPAVAVEGSDAFDAISRALGYVLGRPWRWFFYNYIALVYGAITYLFVGAVIFLSLLVVHKFGGLWVGAEVAPGLNRFEAVMPAPRLGSLSYTPDLSQLTWSAKAAAVVTSVWVNLLIALLAAYAISYFFSSQTWVYLLLRRAADGTEFDDVYEIPASPDESASAGQAPAKTEPSSDAAAAAPESIGDAE